MGEKKPSGGEAGKENKGCLPVVNWLAKVLAGYPLTRGHKERNVKQNGKANDNKKRATQDSKDSKDLEKHRARRSLKFRAAALVLGAAIVGIGVNQCSGDDKPFADSSTSASHADTLDHDGKRNGDPQHTPLEDNRDWANTMRLYTGDPRTDEEPIGIWYVGEDLVIPINNPYELGLDHMRPGEELVVKLTGIKTVTIEEGDSPIGLVQDFNPDVSNRVVEVIVAITELAREPFIKGDRATIPVFEVLSYGDTEVIKIP